MHQMDPNQPQRPTPPHTEKSSFNPSQTAIYQARMRKAPQWWCSLLASNHRERNRLRDELSKMKGAIPLLMKPRNGVKWTKQERAELRSMLRSISSVSPYLVIMALPGSVLILPLLAWHLDARRKRREDKDQEH